MDDLTQPATHWNAQTNRKTKTKTQHKRLYQRSIIWVGYLNQWKTTTERTSKPAENTMKTTP